MFLLILPALGIAAGSALLGGAAGMFSAPDYNPQGNLQDIRGQRPPLNSPWYPGTSTSTPGGGFMGYNPNVTVDLTGQNQRLQNALKGKGKNKNLATNNPGLFQYLQGGGDMSKIPSELFGGKNPELFGLGKKTKGVDFQAQPEPGALQGFNQLQQLEIQRMQDAAHMRDMTQGMIMPPLMNTYGGVFNNANQILKQGVTQLSPGMQSQIDNASQGYLDKTMRDYNQQYKQGMSGMFQNLADTGGYFSSDLGDMTKQGTTSYGRGLADILNNRDIMKSNLAHQMVGENQSGLNTLYGSPAFTGILSGMNQTYNQPYQVNPAAINPTGTFSPDFLANMMQYGSQYGLNRDQIKQNAYTSDVNAAYAAAGQQAGFPTAGQAIGSVFGGLAGTAGGLGIAKYLFPQGFGGSAGQGANPNMYGPPAPKPWWQN